MNKKTAIILQFRNKSKDLLVQLYFPYTLCDMNLKYNAHAFAHPTQLFIITASVTQSRNSTLPPEPSPRRQWAACSVKVNSKEISSAVLVTNIAIYNERIPQIKLFQFMSVLCCNYYNALYTCSYLARNL